MEGCNAVLSCTAREDVKEHLTVTSWFRDDAILLPGNTDTGGRFVVTSQGDLHIRAARPEDGRATYSCLTLHALTSERRRSEPATLTVTEPTGSLGPRLMQRSEIAISAESGSDVHLTCSAQGSPPPQFTWYRDVNGHSIPVESFGRIQLWGDLMQIRRVDAQDAGRYVCRASNHLGEQRAETHLSVTSKLNARIQPRVQVVNSGETATMNCTVEGYPVESVEWLHDGVPVLTAQDTRIRLLAPLVLVIGSVGRRDKGMYQCLVRSDKENAQATAELKLGDTVPELQYTFIEQALRPGPPVSLRCSATGSPTPSFTWLLDGEPLSQIATGHRYAIGQYVDQSGDVISHLNISSAGTEDGGLYACVASNTLATVEHKARLNIYGPPVMTPFSFPPSSQEGSRAQVTCSVTSGDLPIYISWLKDGEPLPSSLRIEERGAEFFNVLVFKELSSRHSGKYTCVATNSAAKVNHTAELLVKVPPQWIFEPQEVATLLGNPLNVHCEAKGFPPPHITWLRAKGKMSNDYQPLVDGSDGRLTILPNGSLWTASASPQDEGQYLCRANNGIGSGLSKVIYVSVHEPARFEFQSENVTIRRGESVTIDCTVIGDNPIEVQWMHNSDRLDMSNHRLSIGQIKTDNGLKSQLSIANSDRQDSGVYRCTADNAYGRSEHLIYLAVQERPDPPAGLEVIEIGSRSIRLLWKRAFDGNSPIRNYVIQYRSLSHGMTDDWNPVKTHNVTYTPGSSNSGNSIHPTQNDLSPFETTGDDQEVALIGGLHPAVTYTFRIFAINSIDASGPTEPVVAKTQEEAPTESPQNIKVQPAGPGELMVSWQPPPKESCNGDLLGYIVTWSEHSSSTSGVNQSKSLTVNGWATTKVQLTGLRKFTKYDISIRAFNSIASGPASVPIVGTTQEGVPETPPTQVTCVPLSSQSVKVSWNAPPPHQHGGIIQGYKVYYRPVPTDNMDISTLGEVKRTSSMETYLHTLYKYTNYSIKVLAYTGAGDGALSPPIFCMTEEDVPGPPAGIKALALTAESILVSWLPPLQPNGNVSKYTVYSREAGSNNHNAHTMHEPPLSPTDTLTMELRDLVERKSYEFWVSATTGLGEGERTTVVTQTTNTRAPARVASFSQVLRRAVKSTVTLSCLVVGNPTPRPIWTYRNGQITTGLEQSVAGNYTCSASNLFGDDSITYSLIVVMPPKAPLLELQYTTTNSIRFRWNHPDNGGATIQGYVLSYKRDQGGWEEIALSPEQTEFVLSGLKCGSSYLAHLTAHNRVDTGDPSPLISATTKGTAPLLPKERDIISANGTSVKLNLLSWPNGGCPIQHYTVEYRRRINTEPWILVASRATENLVIRDLKTASWYSLRLTAHNDAGSTQTQMEFATTTLSGVSIGPPNDLIMEDEIRKTVPNHKVLYVVVPLICAIVLVVSAVILGYVMLKRSGRGNYLGEILPNQQQQQQAGLGIVQQQQHQQQHHHLSSCMSTVQLKSTAERDNRRNHQVYTSSPVKQENHKPTDHGSEMYEISPYATFSVPGRENRSVTTATLDYTMQFKTFGHLENEDINTIDYERSSVEFERSKTPRWHKQRYFPSIAEAESKLRSSRQGSGSDTSGSPCGECAGPSYRVPVKPCRAFINLFIQTMVSHNSLDFSFDLINVSFYLFDSSVEDMTLLPPSGFSDSRELSDVECDRDRDRERDREWQGLSTGTRHGGSLGRLPIEAVESMLARYRHESP
ncbi:Down syndrome cell adhesion molecule [Camponotus floridanus]|uniref:Down syndrome cell adhesion molecule n=1 Tax=Camponotus floridanus TaxID=104421 RepID=E2A3Y9_CAMFO|nr:Down syndrome cell adhesion molecule [Camponotus floridanus]